jgi:hypothetical protein
MLKDAINPTSVRVILVIAQLMLNPKENQYGADHANRQSADVEKGKSFLPDQIPECDFKIVANHL